MKKPTRILQPPFLSKSKNDRKTWHLPTDAGVMTVEEAAKAIGLSSTALRARVFKKYGWQDARIFEKRIEPTEDEKDQYSPPTTRIDLSGFKFAKRRKLGSVKLGIWEIEQLSKEESPC